MCATARQLLPVPERCAAARALPLGVRLESLTEWEALTEAERAPVRAVVLSRHPHLAGTCALPEEPCLPELARRRTEV